eukprot:3708-Heterocapsa_arctica.AAC.1
MLSGLGMASNFLGGALDREPALRGSFPGWYSTGAGQTPGSVAGSLLASGVESRFPRGGLGREGAAR